jgi:hypothetical protein
MRLCYCQVAEIHVFLWSTKGLSQTELGSDAKLSWGLSDWFEFS